MNSASGTRIPPFQVVISFSSVRDISHRRTLFDFTAFNVMAFSMGAFVAKGDAGDYLLMRFSHLWLLSIKTPEVAVAAGVVLGPGYSIKYPSLGFLVVLALAAATGMTGSRADPGKRRPPDHRPDGRMFLCTGHCCGREDTPEPGPGVHVSPIAWSGRRSLIYALENVQKSAKIPRINCF